MKIVSADEMRALERQADAAGVSYHEMMERAGLAVAQAIREARDAKRFPRVAVLAGPGNNGGDGLVAARHLAKWGYQTAVYLAKPRAADDENLRLAAQAGAHIVSGDTDASLKVFRRIVSECDIFVDALLGTGVSRPIEGRFRDILVLAGEQIAARRQAAPRFANVGGGMASVKSAPEPAPRLSPWVVAVDLPSGLNADTGALDSATLPADLTVTFALPKRGHFLFPGAGAVGELLVADIGIRHEWADELPLALMTSEWIAGMLPRRPLNAHKGTFGRALIVAGSVNYTGAAALAAAAAVRAGAGLATLCAGPSVRAAVACQVMETTYLVLPEELGVLREEGAPLVQRELAECQALLVGPGLGQEDTTRRLVWALLGLETERRRHRLGFVGEAPGDGASAIHCPVVVDADGLNALAALDGWHEKIAAPWILTPHPGEMAHLLGCTTAEVQGDRWQMALRAARVWNKIVALKGAHTVVASPDGRAVVCPFANPALATAGTGDVLAGIIVGLLAQGLAPFEAAAAGVYIHALAGELAALRAGTSGLAAGDLLGHVANAMAALRGEKVEE
jgi:NAD(P)H-hydrate epimerase